MPIFSETGQILIFRPKFGNLPNYVQYFGSNIVQGVAENWVEAEMSWVEVDGAGWSCVEVDGAWWRSVHGLVIPFRICVPVIICLKLMKEYQ